ncbi:MAG TPA: hypothetical protein VFF39_11385 [Verrucomicrobiae bacterium]|nr:hypothetical protein [Verrucomicrobiae bacterium]
MDTYECMLGTIESEISFGSTTIRVYRPKELISGQIGYSIDQKGKPLSGDENGDWRNTWLVIGYDETCGDPIFIDTAEEGYPVYTAMIGQSRWDPVCIAVSLAAFGHALSVIAIIAKGREYPVALEQNPLTQSEKDTALATIRKHNPGIDLGFWQTLLNEA